jgi:hypothetical protein
MEAECIVLPGYKLNLDSIGSGVRFEQLYTRFHNGVFGHSLILQFKAAISDYAIGGVDDLVLSQDEIYHHVLSSQ